MDILIYAGTANGDFTFGTPTNLGPTVNSGAGDYDPALSPDGLSLLFGSDRPGGVGGVDLWMTTRPTKDDPWGSPTNLGPAINSPYEETDACLSPNGLTLYFSSTRPDGYGGRDLWVTTRSTSSDPWTPAVNLGTTVNSPSNEGDPSITADGLLLCFSDWGGPRPGGYGSYDIWATTRSSMKNDWGLPLNLGSPVNTSVEDWSPDISGDGLLILFPSNRPGGLGGNDIWLARRPSMSAPWSTPVNLGPGANSSFLESDPDLSAHGRSLFFGSNRSGGNGPDLWQVSISPIADFNGDGKVDGTEIRRMADCWGQTDPLCDIGPTPFGDGVVDLQDLIVLAEFVGGSIDDSTLIAHWRLDETEGDLARDSAGQNDAMLRGDPVWLPSDGKVGGALQLDGIDDCVATEYVVDGARFGLVLSPSDGPFSVFAWVKGGAPGQVVLSQASGANWLMASTVDDALVTELKSPRGGPLLSETIITDGNWHRVGFAWDNSTRALYVDGVLVAEDIQSVLTECYGGLNIGCGKNHAPGSFWSGLIDEVRVYGRAVKP